MTRTIVFLVTLMFVLPSDGSAQAVPSPGDRIRIKQVDGTVLVGALAAWSEETIQLSVDSSRVEVPVARIEVLETSLGKSSSSKNVAITMVVVRLLERRSAPRLGSRAPSSVFRPFSPKRAAAPSTLASPLERWWVCRWGFSSNQSGGARSHSRPPLRRG